MGLQLQNIPDRIWHQPPDSNVGTIYANSSDSFPLASLELFFIPYMMPSQFFDILGTVKMKLYRTQQGIVIEQNGTCYSFNGNTWDSLIARDDVQAFLQAQIDTGRMPKVGVPKDPRPPVVNQEIWAAGVTYMRSREARMEESKSAGGGDFYDRVYVADRPELFFKSTGHRAVGMNGKVRIRKDSKWNVPEPELTLVMSASGKITGYTIGNDMSSRDIEGENPLYLPQAKVYNGSCAIGPCILLSEPLAPETEIQISIKREGKEMFAGSTPISRIKRALGSLAEYLYRELSFPHGALLMTGTGVVPPDTFTLASGDEISITIAPIGTLTNSVA
jgi:2-dehydro-3-deoxy-D-arabinonate dehydratase